MYEKKSKPKFKVIVGNFRKMLQFVNLKPLCETYWNPVGLHISISAKVEKIKTR